MREHSNEISSILNEIASCQCRVAQQCMFNAHGSARGIVNAGEISRLSRIKHISKF